jgi:hypothetical protein
VTDAPGDEFLSQILFPYVTYVNDIDGQLDVFVSRLDFESNPCATTGDQDGDGVCDDADNYPATANADQADADADGAGDACDACPGDGAKVTPGACGCGVADTDADGDGIADCIDACPSDLSTTWTETASAAAPTTARSRPTPRKATPTVTVSETPATARPCCWRAGTGPGGSRLGMAHQETGREALRAGALLLARRRGAGRRSRPGAPPGARPRPAATMRNG